MFTQISICHNYPKKNPYIFKIIETSYKKGYIYPIHQLLYYTQSLNITYKNIFCLIKLKSNNLDVLNFIYTHSNEKNYLYFILRSIKKTGEPITQDHINYILTNESKFTYSYTDFLTIT